MISQPHINYSSITYLRWVQIKYCELNQISTTRSSQFTLKTTGERIYTWATVYLLQDLGCFEASIQLERAYGSKHPTDPPFGAGGVRGEGGIIDFLIQDKAF